MFISERKRQSELENLCLRFGEISRSKRSQEIKTEQKNLREQAKHSEGVLRLFVVVWLNIKFIPKICEFTLSDASSGKETQWGKGKEFVTQTQTLEMESKNLFTYLRIFFTFFAAHSLLCHSQIRVWLLNLYLPNNIYIPSITDTKNQCNLFLLFI